jgi:hypothetical protein
MAGQLLTDGIYDVMVALQGNETAPVPLSEAAGIKKVVPLGHPWLETAGLVDTSLGVRR